MFSNRLKQARSRAHFTQQQMADLLGLSLNGYQKYEQAERSPSLECLVQIADALGVSTDYLLGRDEFLAASADAPRTDLPAHPTPGTSQSACRIQSADSSKG